MKKESSPILEQLGKDQGFKVPEGYFERFNRDLAASLPEVKITPQVKPSMWVRVRPYVYMAAMFAGVWAMLKVFNMFNGTKDLDNMGNEVRAEMHKDVKNYDDFMMYEDVDYDLMQNYQDSIAGNEMLDDF